MLAVHLRMLLEFWSSVFNDCGHWCIVGIVGNASVMVATSVVPWSPDMMMMMGAS